MKPLPLPPQYSTCPSSPANEQGVLQVYALLVTIVEPCKTLVHVHHESKPPAVAALTRDASVKNMERWPELAVPQ